MDMTDVIIIPCNKCRKRDRCKKYKSIINDIKEIRVGDMVFKLEHALIKIECDDAEVIE